MCTLLTLNICLMCHTQELWLNNTKIGDAGLTALAKAVESGALASLTDIYLWGNNVSWLRKRRMKFMAWRRGFKAHF